MAALKYGSRRQLAVRLFKSRTSIAERALRIYSVLFVTFTAASDTTERAAAIFWCRKSSSIFPRKEEAGTRGLRKESEFSRLQVLLTEIHPPVWSWPPAVNPFDKLRAGSSGLSLEMDFTHVIDPHFRFGKLHNLYPVPKLGHECSLHVYPVFEQLLR